MKNHFLVSRDNRAEQTFLIIVWRAECQSMNHHCELRVNTITKKHLALSVQRIDKLCEMCVFLWVFFFKAILQMLQYRRPCHQGSCVFYYLESRGRTQPGRVFAKTVTLVRPFRRSDDLIRTTAVEWRKPIVSAMSVSRERKLLSLR